MTVSTDIQNDIALITIDDGKANAINFALMDEINAALDTAEAGAKSIVLTGREGRFSGGFDLKAFANFTAEDSMRLLDEASKLLLRLYSGPLPVVAACNGHAIAMGVFILLACDTRVGAAGEFKLGANETVNNMRLPVFAIELARDRLHPHYLTRTMVQSTIYDPQGAVDAGILDMLAPPAKLVETAINIAGKLGSLPTKAYAYNKAAMRKPAIDLIKAAIGDQPNLRRG